MGHQLTGFQYISSHAIQLEEFCKWHRACSGPTGKVNGRVKSNESGSQIGLIGGHTECVLIWNNSAICFCSTITFVAPIYGFSPLFCLIEPITPSIKANITTYCSRTPDHYTSHSICSFGKYWMCST